MLFQQNERDTALLSGETGEAAEHMPSFTCGLSRTSLGDIMGQRQAMGANLGKVPLLNCRQRQGGGHLSIAAPRAEVAATTPKEYMKS